MTAKTRITLLVAISGFVASLIFSVVIFLELIEQPFDIMDNMLKEEAQRTLQTILKQQKNSDSKSPDNNDTNPMSAYWIEIKEQGSDKLIYRSGLAKTMDLPSLTPGSGKIASASISSDKKGQSKQDNNYEMTFWARNFLISSQGRAYIVQIARPLGELEVEIWNLVYGIGSGLILSSLFLIAISRFISHKILHPIGSMKDLTKNISEKNLDQRLPVGKEMDEFNELKITINQMLDRLHYSFTRQRDFLFDTSHELKTPLTTIRLTIEEICNSCTEGASNKTVQESLFRLQYQVLRMEKLVKDLLRLSNLEIINAVKPEPIDLAYLILSLKEEYQLLANSFNITIEDNLPNQFFIQGDYEKLNRAFSNILDNAIKYNIEGGKVRIVGDNTEDNITISIGNTGPGVSENESEKIFQQFYRVEKSRSQQYGGSGLGLAIVRKTIELHKGEIKFESKPNDWTWIRVSLPIRQ